MALKKSQRSLRAWTKQKWRTKSGKKSSETGERYLPEKAIKSLSAAEYAATTRKKRRDTKRGKQHSKQPKRIAKKTRRARQFRNTGGKIESNKSSLSFNPLAEFMLDSLLVERIQKRVGGKVASSLIRGIGDNISKFPELLDDITDKPVSDKVAGKIFDVDKEVDEIKALQKRIDGIKFHGSTGYTRLLRMFDGDDEKIDVYIDTFLTPQVKNLRNQIQKIKEKAINKIDNKLNVVIQRRTIPELDPKFIDRPDIETIANVSANVPKKEGVPNWAGQKNKAIIENTARLADSPGFDKNLDMSYALKKMSPSRFSSVAEASRELKPRGYGEYMNPLEVYESGKSFIPTTFILGSVDKPFFVDPFKLMMSLQKSTGGQDFLKQRRGTKDFISEVDKLEDLIRENTYKPQPISIVIYPTGSAFIHNGNHRLQRALLKKEKEVPVEFSYLAGAERVEGPFSIKKLYQFPRADKFGYKNKAEFQEYIDEVNESYLIDNYTGK